MSFVFVHFPIFWSRGRRAKRNNFSDYMGSSNTIQEARRTASHLTYDVFIAYNLCVCVSVHFRGRKLMVSNCSLLIIIPKDFFYAHFFFFVRSLSHYILRFCHHSA